MCQHLCQRSVRIQRNFPFSNFPFPFSKVLIAAAHSLSPSPLSKWDASEEKQVPSRNAVGQGESRSHYLWFMNPSINCPGCCGTSKWSLFILWTKLPGCPSVVCFTCAFRAAQQGSPVFLYWPACYYLALQTKNKSFLKKLIFLPSATSFQSCCAALALAAAWMNHSKLYLFSALLSILMCLSCQGSP